MLLHVRATETDDRVMAMREITLSRPDVCVVCGADLETGVEAMWDPSRRTVTCLECADASRLLNAVGEDAARPVDCGRPGASLAREYERRRASRERRVRDAHPRIGGALLALSEEPQHQKAFRQGEKGELAVGAVAERAAATVGGTVLHNRRMPGGRGDIDHIAIVPSGVYVIDAKAVKGKIEIRRLWFKPPRLFIAGRDRTAYLDRLDRQIDVVETALGPAGCLAVSIQGVLCFTDADLPLLRSVELRGHLLLYRRRLAKRLIERGPLDDKTIVRLAAVLDASLTQA